MPPSRFIRLNTSFLKHDFLYRRSFVVHIVFHSEVFARAAGCCCLSDLFIARWINSEQRMPVTLARVCELLTPFRCHEKCLSENTLRAASNSSCVPFCLVVPASELADS